MKVTFEFEHPYEFVEFLRKLPLQTEQAHKETNFNKTDSVFTLVEEFNSNNEKQE